MICHMNNRERVLARMCTRMGGSRGFTLIELLVVIAIIGILSSVVLASLNSARQKGRDARRISDMKQLQLALELSYDLNSSEYPDEGASDTLPSSLVSQGFIGSIPADPQGGAYQYNNLTSSNGACTVATGVCARYVIRAVLEGTVPAGALTGTLGAVTCTPANKDYCVGP